MTQNELVTENIRADLFSFRGRIGRDRFWAMIFLALITLLLVGWLVSGIPDPIGRALRVLVVILWFWVMLTNFAKRLHDLDRSGFLALGMFIPLIDLFMLIYLGCVRGNPGPNQYGEKSFHLARPLGGKQPLVNS